MTLQSLYHFWGRHGKFTQSNPNRPVDCVGERSGWWDDGYFPDASYPIRMSGIGDFHDDGLNHRQVETGRHAIVQKAGIQHLARFIVNILLVKGPSNALDRSSLHLSFQLLGMHR